MQRLAGRLQFEHTADGVRIKIPARGSWQAILALVLLAAWTALAIAYRGAIPSNDQASSFAWFNLAFSIAGLLFVAGMLLWSFTGRSIVTITPSEIWLERRVVGLPWDSRTFRADLVGGLRYIPPSCLYKYAPSDHYPSKMELSSGNKLYRFARGITEREACALVDQANSIVKFTNAHV